MQRYRLYVDESGSHAPANPDEQDPGKRYLGVVGVMIEETVARQNLHRRMQQLKEKHFNPDPDGPPIILHLADIIGARGRFACLRDVARWGAFQEDVAGLIATTQFRVIAVVVDKSSHGTRAYRSLTHPYHYCIHALMERYCGLLNHIGATGDVMVEKRGAKEDRLLAKEYSEVHQYGTRYLDSSTLKRVLTSREIKIKPKESNIAGLQLADLLVNPLRCDVLTNYGRPSPEMKSFANAVVAAAVPKYNMHLYTGRIDGYGRVFLA